MHLRNSFFAVYAEDDVTANAADTEESPNAIPSWKPILELA
jgi:hypothetical protein